MELWPNNCPRTKLRHSSGIHGPHVENCCTVKYLAVIILNLWIKSDEFKRFCKKRRTGLFSWSVPPSVAFLWLWYRGRRGDNVELVKRSLRTWLFKSFLLWLCHPSSQDLRAVSVIFQYLSLWFCVKAPILERKSNFMYCWFPAVGTHVTFGGCWKTFFIEVQEFYLRYNLCPVGLTLITFYSTKSGECPDTSISAPEEQLICKYEVV